MLYLPFIEVRSINDFEEVEGHSEFLRMIEPLNEVEKGKEEKN